jgi:hypothetical protein
VWLLGYEGPAHTYIHTYILYQHHLREPGVTLLLGDFFKACVKEDGRQAETQIHQAMEFCDTEEGVTVKGMYYAIYCLLYFTCTVFCTVYNTKR